MLVKMKINGIELELETDKLHESWVNACLEYGVRRKVQDTYASEKGKEKLDLVKAMIKEMESGAVKPERTRAVAAGLSNAETLALKTAKQDLVLMFKKLTGSGKAIEMAQHPKVAPFYKVSEDRATWNDESVLKWMDKQGANGVRNYIEEAKAILKEAEALDDELGTVLDF